MSKTDHPMPKADQVEVEACCPVGLRAIFIGGELKLSCRGCGKERLVLNILIEKSELDRFIGKTQRGPKGVQ